MEYAIFDTSVWINFSRGIENKETALLEKYLSEYPDLIILTPTIIQEFLMGLKTEKHLTQFETHFKRLTILEDNWLENSVDAAKIYFNLRKKGISVRKSTDCLIAQFAIKNNFLLVHSDTDFDLIAKGTNLKTIS